jgi:Spy/CpxP family protein refolding chaperone
MFPRDFHQPSAFRSASLETERLQRRKVAMRINAWVLCLTAGLAFATTVQAQPGGGGRGGFGGGRGGMGGGGGVMGLAGNEAVQKDLGLTEADVAKVKVVTEEYGTALRDAFQNAPRPNFQDMTPEERTKAMEEMQKTTKGVTDKFLPKLKTAITPSQFTRLQQISWQAMGTAAYSDAEVVKALTITKEQTDKITALSDEYRTKGRDLFQGGGGPEAFAKMQDLNKERDAKVNEVLTKAQLDQFAMLKGKEFDVAQLRGGRGGPGGGGGGGGAGARPKRPQPKAE